MNRTVTVMYGCGTVDPWSPVPGVTAWPWVTDPVPAPDPIPPTLAAVRAETTADIAARILRDLSVLARRTERVSITARVVTMLREAAALLVDVLAPEAP